MNCVCGQVVAVDRSSGPITCPACGRALDAGQPSGIQAPTTRPAGPPRNRERDERDEDDDVESRSTGRLWSHSGDPLPDNQDVFAQAPSEIGELLSVSSSLTRTAEVMRYFLRSVFLVLILAATAFGVFLMYEVARVWGFRPLDTTTGLLLVMSPMFVGILLLALAWKITSFKYACRFVGAKGIAYVKCTQRRDHIVSTDIVLFRESRGLYVRLGHSFIRSLDRLHFEFVDGQDQVVHVITVHYNPRLEVSHRQHALHFALAAERAWTQYLLRHRDECRERDGTWAFFFRDGSQARLSDDTLELDGPQGTLQINRIQLVEVVVDPGYRAIWLIEPGAKFGWFSNVGAHLLWYPNMENAQFFLELLQRVWDAKIKRM